MAYNRKRCLMRTIPVYQLNPIRSVAHASARPALERLTDSELLAAVRNPNKGDYLTINTRTGVLVDGNGRAHELLRRLVDPNSAIQADTLVPVREYAPDLSMFPDLI